MQLQTLKIFRDLVETGSFSQSASRNNVSQSAVSQQIRTLENKYGVSFFERGRKKFSITPEGILFDKAAKSILQSFDEVGRELNHMRNVVAGPLKISTVYSIGLHDLPEPLETFRQQHASVDVQVQYRRAPVVYEEILDGTADIGLVPFPGKSDGVITDIFAEDELVLICAPSHELAKKKRVRPSELQDREFVAFEYDATTRKSLNKIFKQNSIRFSNQHEFEDIETVKRVVTVASVISLVPRKSVETEIQAGTLCALKIEGASKLTRPLAIIRKQGHITTPAAREFMNLLLKR